jgi:hypothetical protein
MKLKVRIIRKPTHSDQSSIAIVGITRIAIVGLT